MRTMSRPLLALMRRMASGATVYGRSRGRTPSPRRTCVAFGESGMPAPASSRRIACSRITTRNPARASASAALRPPIPAPATMMVRERAKRRVPSTGSGGGRNPGAFRRERLIGVELWIVTIECRAIRANEFALIAHVAEHVRMVEWRRRANAHELLCADFDDRRAGVVLKMRNDVLGHDLSRGNP